MRKVAQNQESMTLKRPKAVIFDMDGLMLDTEIIYRGVWGRAGKTVGIEITDEFYLGSIGKRREDNQRRLVEVFGPEFDGDTFWRLRDEYWIEESQKGIPHKPGLLELLNYLQQSEINIGLSTSNNRPHALRSLTLADIAPYFAHITSGDDVDNGKPAPDVFLATAEKLGVSPSDCWVLEDSEAGIAGAYAAGMTPIMIPDMKPPTADVKMQAASILPSLHHVLEMLV
jgi:HAD superfamily hydrolase (TIGR01509 family)|tara:strand:- start:1136 stop:1819 length:684 start_codon:yes stop_codon:yes gene_type:complete